MFKKKKFLKKNKINFHKKNKIILTTFHPETTISKKQNIKNLITLIKFLIEINQIVIFTYPGADFGYNNFIKIIEKIKNNKIYKFKNLGIDQYYQFLKIADHVIGNSSSGIIETSAFKIPTLDLGNRQKLRFKNKNVLNSKFNLKNLRISYKKIISKTFISNTKKIKDLYKLKMDSSRTIKKIIQLD